MDEIQYMFSIMSRGLLRITIEQLETYRDSVDSLVVKEDVEEEKARVELLILEANRSLEEKS